MGLRPCLYREKPLICTAQVVMERRKPLLGNFSTWVSPACSWRQDAAVRTSRQPAVHSRLALPSQQSETLPASQVYFCLHILL